MIFIDSHCHLDFEVFDEQRDRIVRDAAHEKVTHMVVPATTAERWPMVNATAERYPNAVAAYGLHPMFCEQHRPEHLQQLLLQCTNHPTAAIGECGLDFAIDTDRAVQMDYFVPQLAIAKQLKLPVIVHARKAVEAALLAIKGAGLHQGVFHSYSGSYEQAKRLIDQGFHLGFGGPFTHPKATKLRKLLTQLPLDAIVLESDAPDQADHEWRGNVNVPARVAAIAKALAELRGEALTAIAERCLHNSQQLFFPHLGDTVTSSPSTAR